MQLRINKLFNIVAIILCIIIFSSCSFRQRDLKRTEEFMNSLEKSSKMLEDNSQDNEKELIKIEKQEYNGELNVDGENNLNNRQKLIIQSIIISLGEANIYHNFNGIDDIKSFEFPTYLSFRSKYFFDISLDEMLKVVLDYDQVLTILKSDFGITTAPEWLEEKKDKKIKLFLPTKKNDVEIISINQNENTIIVIAKISRIPVCDSSEKETLTNTFKYTFETNDKGEIILKSGEFTKV